MTYNIEIVPGPPLHVFRSLNGMIRGKVITVSGLLINKTTNTITISAEGLKVDRLISAFDRIEKKHKVSTTYVLTLPPNHPFLQLDLDQVYQFNANGTVRNRSTGGGIV
jgi:hypothetical protein